MEHDKSAGSPETRVIHETRYLRFDIGKLDKFERTPAGGLKVPAFLSRSGVLTYKNADGTERQELRHPEDIFTKVSLDTLKGATLTEGHQAIIDPGNFRNYAVGHTGDDVRRDGDKIAATLHINDANTIRKIESGALKEISLGYSVDVKEERGDFNGETYTHRQMNPVYNHVALGPDGWGRAGKEVGLRLDGHTYPLNEEHKLTDAMTEKAADPVKVEIKVDAAEVEKLRGENAALAARNKELEAKVSTFDADVQTRLDASLALRKKASTVLGWDKVKGSDSEVMVAAISARSKEFKADGLSGAALESAFNFALTLPAPGLAKANVAMTHEGKEDANPVEDAYSRMVKKNEKLWKGDK